MSRYGMEDLLTLMEVLRDPVQGCPWDLDQAWDSIVPHTLEEAHEVADAIERRAFDELPAELGDLLFQVVYYAQLGKEEARFDFADIIDTLVRKMLKRHPHVFPDGTLASRRPPHIRADAIDQADINRRWEAHKAADASPLSRPSLLDGITAGLPALSRSVKLTRRAAQVGFDWPDSHGVRAKIREELEEVEQALEGNDPDHLADEVGDLLFAVTNLARKLSLDPEQCLRRTNRKFERRFRYLETALDSPLHGASLSDMETHWQAAKALEKAPDEAPGKTHQTPAPTRLDIASATPDAAPPTRRKPRHEP